MSTIITSIRRAFGVFRFLLYPFTIYPLACTLWSFSVGPFFLLLLFFLWLAASLLLSHARSWGPLCGTPPAVNHTLERESLDPFPLEIRLWAIFPIFWTFGKKTFFSIDFRRPFFRYFGILGPFWLPFWLHFSIILATFRMPFFNTVLASIFH